jgi:hypothetical protein
MEWAHLLLVVKPKDGIPTLGFRFTDPVNFYVKLVPGTELVVIHACK